MCRGARERIAMLRWLLRIGVTRLLGRPSPSITTLSIDGFRLTLDWAAAEQVAVREILGRGEYWPRPELRPSTGQVVVDVGANAGVFSTVVGTWIGPTGRLLAIEPNPRVVGRLRRNLRQNDLSDRATVVETALSNRAGTALLAVGTNTTIASIVDPVSAGPAPTMIEVPMQTLDDVTRQVGLAWADLLKIDVEGAEQEVLDGSSSFLTRCRRVVIEISSDTDVPVAVDRFRDAGFEQIVTRRAGADSLATIVFASRSSMPLSS
jgi:FkbM family methyltransferase